MSNTENKIPANRAGEFKHTLIALLCMVLLVLAVYVFDIPNPNMILITGLTVFTTMYGLIPGGACAVVMVVYSLYFFSTDHDFITFSSLNLQKMAVIILGIAMNLICIGNLNRRYAAAHKGLMQINELLKSDNLALEEASMMDAVTGIRNRHALTTHYNQYEGQRLFTMMLDVDGFKSINDKHGHPVGDYVLKQIGAALDSIWGRDNCYRYGGDEFLVIFRDEEEDVFRGQLVQLQNALDRIQLDRQPIPIHFSAGYVYGECSLVYDLRLMIHQADSLLYQAKFLGKNRYVGENYSREKAEALGKGLRSEGKRATDHNAKGL